MKIAVQLNSDRNIIDTYLSPEDGAKLQVEKYSDQGWVLVDNDPAFSTENKYLWTVRQADNKLVHIDTMLTPEEESHKSTKELTDIVLANSTDIEDIKKSVMVLTNMKLNPDTTSTMGGN